MGRKTDKRARLVQAAKTLIHQQGFSLTTLADIAQEADVPLGNVYYYFKTKEAIGEAVIEDREQELADLLCSWEKNSQPNQRLMNYVMAQLETIESIARFGSPIGGLCHELAKQGGPLSDSAARLLHHIIGWSQSQFAAMGFSPEKSRQFAIDFLARLQGMALLANTFKDPKYASAVAQQISDWLKQLAVVQLKESAVTAA